MKSLGRNSFYFSLILVVTVWAACFELGLVPASMAAPAYIARVVSTSGSSHIRNGRVRKETKVAMQIFEKDVIETKKDGRVKLLFTDKTIVDLGPSTKFKVDEYKIKGKVESRRVAMDMDYGKIRTSVNRKVKRPGRFTFKTKSATMGIRGTEFFAEEFDDGVQSRSSVTVTEGKVEYQPTGQGATRNAAPEARAPKTLTQGQRLTSVVDANSGRAIAGNRGQQGSGSSGADSVSDTVGEGPSADSPESGSEPRNEPRQAAAANAGEAPPSAPGDGPADGPTDAPPPEEGPQGIQVQSLTEEEMATETADIKFEDDTFAAAVEIGEDQEAGAETMKGVSDLMTAGDFGGFTDDMIEGLIDQFLEQFDFDFEEFVEDNQTVTVEVNFSP